MDLYSQEIFEYAKNQDNFEDLDILRLILPAKREELMQFFNALARKNDVSATDEENLKLLKELDALNTVLVSKAASTA